MPIFDDTMHCKVSCFKPYYMITFETTRKTSPHSIDADYARGAIIWTNGKQDQWGIIALLYDKGVCIYTYLTRNHKNSINCLTDINTSVLCIAVDSTFYHPMAITDTSILRRSSSHWTNISSVSISRQFKRYPYLLHTSYPVMQISDRITYVTSTEIDNLQL